MSFIESLIAFFIATFGSALQGSIGFGLGLIGVPLLVILNPVFVPGPILLSALFLTILIAWRERYAISLKEIKWAVLGRILGSALGSFILIIIPQKNISILFGSMILFAVMISISGIKLELNPKNLFGAGTVSGIMSTTSAIGGAPIALIYQYQKGSKIRGTLSTIFIFGTLISLSALLIIHRFGLREIYVTTVLIPGILLGFFGSKRLAKILDRGLMRPAVLIASAFSGIIVLIKNLF